MKINYNLSFFSIFCLFFTSCNKTEVKSYASANQQTSEIAEWEGLRFGAFVHFNDNTCIETELSKNTDPMVFNPINLNFDTIMSTFQKAGVKYAVLTAQESYDLLKRLNPKAFVHFNQHVQDGTKINYFPIDVVNGEERIPPVAGHNPNRTVDSAGYYLPFEYEITSQRCDSLSLGNGLMKGSVWFTYPQSQFYPVDSLYKYIAQSFERGGSNILLSTAPDKTGTYRQADCDSIIKLGSLILGREFRIKNN